MGRRSMTGALIGLLLLLLDIPARLLVLVLAIRGRYPWWLITPDDPVSPFGLYEPAMRRAYFGTAQPLPGGYYWMRPTGWRRYWGDVLWLAGRNVLFGLTMWFKPNVFAIQDGESYHHILGVKREYGWCQIYNCAGYGELVVRYFEWNGRTYGGMFGWHVMGIVNDPFTPRRAVNAEGRPMLSPIRVISR